MSIIINGGGIIGSILALMLSKLTKGNVDISLIEQCSPDYFDTSLFSNTPSVIALSKGTYSDLIQIGIKSILSNYSSIIDQIEISEHRRFNKILIKAQDYQLSALGYVVKLHLLRKQLFNLLVKEKSISIYHSATITQIIQKKSHNVIFLNNGKQITAKLVIAADGSCSKLATNCGIQWFHWNYQQTAVVAEIITEIPHFGKAFERFTTFGSIALLPIADNLSFLIWCISNHKQKAILSLDKNKFSRELQNLFGWKLGKILDINTRNFYDLRLVYAKNHFTHRLALVGNAAQNLHPIAGQGFNLGVRDAITLSKIIHQALCDGIDIGDYYMLSLYQKYRRIDQYRTIAITDGLIRLFNNNYLPLIIARNLGLFCIGYSTFLKWFLVNSVLLWKTN